MVLTFKVAEGLSYISENMETVAKYATVLAAVGLAKVFGNLTTSIYKNVSASIAETKATQANILAARQRIAAQILAGQVADSLAIRNARLAQVDVQNAANSAEATRARAALYTAKQKENALVLASSICSINPSSINEPFKPFIQFENKCSAIPDHFSKEQLCSNCYLKLSKTPN